MTTYVVEFNVDGVDDPDAPYPVDSMDDLDMYLDMLGATFAPTGLRVLARVGPQDGPAALLLGVNDAFHDDAGRAMIQWLPTGEYGASADAEPPTGEVRFDGLYLDGINAVRTFAPNASRVTTTSVRAAVREYVELGRKPAAVSWIAAD